MGGSKPWQMRLAKPDYSFRKGHRQTPVPANKDLEQGMATVKARIEAGNFQLKDQVVSINRVTKVVKGGKNLSFAALVVVGDPSSAVVGFGSGKAKEVPQAIRKGIEAAKKNLMRVTINQTTNPHNVIKATFDALKKLKDRGQVAAARGKNIQEL